MQTNKYTRTHTHAHTHTYTHTQTHIHTHTNTHKHTHKQTLTQTLTQTHTHIQTQSHLTLKALLALETRRTSTIVVVSVRDIFTCGSVATWLIFASIKFCKKNKVIRPKSGASVLSEKSVNQTA